MNQAVPDTEPLRLRKIVPSNLALFTALYADPTTMQHIAAPLDAAQLAALFTRAQILPGIGYRVIEREGGDGECEALGLGALFGTGHERELGLMLLPAHAGAGHGRPALRMLMALARADGVTTLHAKHARTHRAVAWLLAACGFTHAGDEDTHRRWRRALE